MKYLTHSNIPEKLDMQLNNSFVNFSFKDFSAEFNANFTDDSLMRLYIFAISTFGSKPASRLESGLI